MKENKDWSDADEDIIRREWKDGKTASEISALFTDRSRNAILGKVHRMGLPPRFTRTVPTKVKKRPAVTDAASRETIASPAVTGARYQPDETPANLVSLVSLKTSQCAWPYGDPKEVGFGFCGADCKPGSVYCAAHHKRAFQPMYNKKDYAERVLTSWAVGK